MSIIFVFEMVSIFHDKLCNTFLGIVLVRFQNLYINCFIPLVLKMLLVFMFLWIHTIIRIYFSLIIKKKKNMLKYIYCIS